MNPSSERSLFLDLIEIEDVNERRRQLQSHCLGDDRLRQAVERLLDAHERLQLPLDKSPLREAQFSPSPSSDSTLGQGDIVPFEPIQRMVGPYRLMEQIGEGGFGLVYVAQQEKPVKRKVALKMIKPGMGSKEVIARFEAERQALAMMDHPCIARVFDAGVSDDSHPYFVMELVRGVPITEFCDKSKSSIQQRLELFIDVCSAVHHAHQKGVIHRDLKPSNVLTTLYDDKPVAKVIDFGIAKAIGQSLTDKTIYTRFMSMMGTPLYMSPEQAEMNTLDVDTRSDIYSLGVLLYELLTGTTPIDKSRMDVAGYHEIRRIIVEEEPPLPSNRVSTLGNRISTISGTRQIDPHRLTSSLRGDLDWIVMKAIDKDRTRRYDSAAAMARDIHCYLNSEPIEARPPSSLYRLGKFARKNRLPLISATLIASSLIAGTAFSVYQMSNAISALKVKDVALRDALQAKAEANAARIEVSQFSERLVQSNVMVSSGQAHAAAGRWQAAIDDYDQAVSLQPNFYLPWVQRGQLYSQLQLWDEASNDLANAIRLGAPTDQPQWSSAGALFALTKNFKALSQLVQQEQKRIDPKQAEFDWQSLRNCVVDATESTTIPWKEVAAQAETRAEHRGPMHDEMRGGEKGGPNRRRGDPNRFGPWKGDASDRDPRSVEPDKRIMGPNGFGEEHGPNGDEHPAPDRFSPPGFGAQGGFGGPEDSAPFGGPGRREGPMAGVGLGPGNPQMRSRRGGFLPHGAQHYLIALCYLRSGDAKKTLEMLNKSELDRGWPGLGLIHAVRAIALHRNGDIELARKSLALSQQTMAGWGDAIANSSTTASPIPWFDFVEGVVLHREASNLIIGDVHSDEEILDLIRKRATDAVTEG